MEKKTANKLKDMVCMKLDDMAKQSVISNADIEKLSMLVESYEKLLKIEEKEGMGEYSQGRGGNWTAEGSYERGYNHGNSYGNSYGYENGDSMANRGQHWVRGHYSRAEAADMTKQKLRSMMSEGNMSESDRRTLEEAMNLM